MEKFGLRSVLTTITTAHLFEYFVEDKEGKRMMLLQIMPELVDDLK